MRKTELSDDENTPRVNNHLGFTLTQLGTENICFEFLAQKRGNCKPHNTLVYLEAVLQDTMCLGRGIAFSADAPRSEIDPDFSSLRKIEYRG